MPLVSAEVFVVQTAATAVQRGVRAAANGRYTLTGVPAGTVTIRVRLVGYQPKDRTITVVDGQTTTVDFALVPRSTQLDQVVVTGTAGATQRRAVGNVIESIKADEVLQVAPVRSVEQLIGSRTPGLIVLPPSGQVGTGAQLRVRGVSSLSLTNDPIVYIDGVRMDANTAQGPVQRGGGGSSRLNDINPDDIESIEVIKGPAASTLYGTEASNGVIQIITKRGRTGNSVFDFSTRQGENWMENPIGRSGELYGKVATTGEIIHFNLYQHEMVDGHGPIFTDGKNQGYNTSLSGGTDANRYFLTGSYDDDVGVVPWNWDKKFSARANVDVLPTNKLRLQASIGHIRDRVRLAQSAIDIDPFSNLVWGTPLTMNAGQRGFSTAPPEEWSTAEAHADNDRTTVSLTGMYSPFEWFSHRLVTGLDVSGENNWSLYPRQPNGNLDFLGADGLGNKSDARTSRTFLTLDYSGSAKYGWKESLRLTSSIGLQAYRSELSTISATASTFAAAPITTVSGGATTSGAESYQANATVGMFGQQEVAWNNRLFFTAALRGDDNSSFGKQFKAAYYPKVSGSWVISEEPWWHVPVVTKSFACVRRSAPRAHSRACSDAARLYVPSVGYQNGAGLVPGSFGNPQLRPERSRESELGFETSLFSGRADVSYTHYARNITDAIVNSPIAPSVGRSRLAGGSTSVG